MMSNNRTPKTIAERADDYARQTSYNASPAQAWRDGYLAGVKREPTEVLRLRLALYLRSRDARQMPQPGVMASDRAWREYDRAVSPRAPLVAEGPYCSLDCKDFHVNSRTEPVTRTIYERDGYKVEETNEVPVLKLDDTTSAKVWP